MKLVLFQKGFNYSQDGPGNRLVYHLKGCNMRCPWCSNPEGLYCDRGQSFTMTVDEMVNEVLLSKPMFFENGGITFTGGEATLQAAALKVVLSKLREHNIHTAIETNGSYEKLPEILHLIDYLIVDFKHPDNKKHMQYTGVSNETIKRNISEAAKSGMDLLIRVPLIGGVNTDQEIFDDFLLFFKEINSENVHFELLKYHEYGKDKWDKCGLTYAMANAFVEEKTRLDFETKMKNIGLKVVRT